MLAKQIADGIKMAVAKADDPDCDVALISAATRALWDQARAAGPFTLRRVGQLLNSNV